MWFIAGRNSKIRKRPDGTKVTAECPSCKERKTFREVEVVKAYHLFFVNLYDDVTTGVRCDDCGDVFTEKDAEEILETAAPLSAKEREKDDAARARVETARLEAAARREEAAAQAKAEAEAKQRRLVTEHENAKRRRESEVDAELDALKRRLGK